MKPEKFVQKSYRLYINGHRLYATDNKKFAKMLYNKYAKQDCKLVLASPESSLIPKESLILNYGIAPYYSI